jgi:hypothetical protein
MKAAQKITSVFLALLFLISSLGFTVNKMVCLKSGWVKFSLVHVKDCCPEKRSALPVVKSDCCDITNTFFQLGDLRVNHKAQKVTSLSLDYFFTSRTAVCNVHSFSKPPALSFADLPPPRYGRSLLSYISVLLI